MRNPTYYVKRLVKLKKAVTKEEKIYAPIDMNSLGHHFVTTEQNDLWQNGEEKMEIHYLISSLSFVEYVEILEMGGISRCIAMST